MKIRNGKTEYIGTSREARKALKKMAYLMRECEAEYKASQEARKRGDMDAVRHHDHWWGTYLDEAEDYHYLFANGYAGIRIRFL